MRRDLIEAAHCLVAGDTKVLVGVAVLAGGPDEHAEGCVLELCRGHEAYDARGPLGRNTLQRESPTDDARKPRRGDRSLLSDDVLDLAANNLPAGRVEIEPVEHLQVIHDVVVRRHELDVGCAEGDRDRGFDGFVGLAVRRGVRRRFVSLRQRCYLMPRRRLRGAGCWRQIGRRRLRGGAFDAGDDFLGVADPVGKPDALDTRPPHKADENAMGQGFAIADGSPFGVVGAIEEYRDPGAVLGCSDGDVDREIRESDVLACVQASSRSALTTSS